MPAMGEGAGMRIIGAACSDEPPVRMDRSGAPAHFAAASGQWN